MRRILIIAYHFPPDAAVGALRPLKFAKYLPQFGWEPWVLTVRPEYYESLDRSRLDEVTYLSKVFPTRMLPHPKCALQIREGVVLHGDGAEPGIQPEADRS